MSKRTRLEFHEILVEVLGSSNVYFQPPRSFKMKYPCIVYSRSVMETTRADNLLYTNRIGYSVILIDANPDSSIPEKLGKLSLSRFDRHYTAENLNHDVYTIFY